MPTYEIRRSGSVICSSTIPDCGYPKEILRDMERNGKREKAASGRSRTESGKGK